MFPQDVEDEDGGGWERQPSRSRSSGQRNNGKADTLPELYSLHRARVLSVRPFGLFVRLEGFQKHGLVHVSQVSNHEVAGRDDDDDVRVQAISSVAAKGDRVWVKVISLKEESGNVKIGCSLKFVSQSTGQDLDPNNVKLNQQPLRPSHADSTKVTLGAVYNVVCSRCGGHGHLKSECYSTGDKSYELLPDDDELEQELPDSKSRSNAGKPSHDNKPDRISKLPDRVTTVEEALAVIARIKKDKKERKQKTQKRKSAEEEQYSRESTKHKRKKNDNRSKHSKMRKKTA
eukprot:c26080_g1_i1 orf=617-1480(-)